jgi:putative spermidine/putrescine transport system substrate-binding protein
MDEIAPGADLAGGMSRRATLKGAAGAAAALGLTSFNINHAWSKDVIYDGAVYNAGGATLPIAEWGGFWQDIMKRILMDQFEKDFNCKISWDTSWPWFPKFVANPKDKPPFALTNWNYPELYKTANAGDYFMPLDDVVANVPNAADVWPFAKASGLGITWAYSRYCFAYRTDMAQPPPTKFTDFWDSRYGGGKRGTYITSNTLQMDFFIMSNRVFGKDQYDDKAGYDAMKRAMPMKISDFTGNMETLLERGEVAIAVQNDAEVYMPADKGIKIAALVWEEYKPILTQTRTISRYADPAQKKLAMALLNRILSPEFLTKFAATFYMRPTHRNVVIPPNLARHGIKNTEQEVAGYWTPDWQSYLKREDDIVDTVNGIFSG